MKRERWIPLAVTAVVAVILAIYPLTNPFLFDPLFGKSYESTFYAFNTSSAHAGGINICLTKDGCMVRNYENAAKLKEVVLDPDEFTALCTTPGFWNEYSPEYICQHTSRAWYGTSIREDHPHFFCYLLLLDNGELLAAQGSKTTEFSDRAIYKIEVLEPYGSQADFFEWWNSYIMEYRQNRFDHRAFWHKMYYKYR